jgi:hypothetical protein
MRFAVVVCFAIMLAASAAASTFVAVTNASAIVSGLGRPGTYGEGGPCDEKWNIIYSYIAVDNRSRDPRRTTDLMVCDSRLRSIGGCQESCSASITVSDLSPNTRYFVSLSGISHSGVRFTAGGTSKLLYAKDVEGEGAIFFANSTEKIEVTTDAFGNLKFDMSRDFMSQEDSLYYNFGNAMVHGWIIEEAGPAAIVIPVPPLPRVPSTLDSLLIITMLALLIGSFLLIAFLLGYIVNLRRGGRSSSRR